MMDLLEKFIPTSFPQALGGMLAFIAVLAGALSLIVGLRAHTLRLLAIFVVTALALFSNDVTTYFIAIFVIATAVTELEFLQNLAAIVRGNKEYFDYKKEALSRERKLDLLAAEAARTAVVTESSVDGSSKTEAAEPDNSEKEPGDQHWIVDTAEKVTATDKVLEDAQEVSLSPPDEVLEPVVEGQVRTPIKVFDKTGIPKISSLSQSVRRIYDLEGKAFDKLELLYDKAVERGVRLRRGSVEVELDGLISKFDGEKDKVFEVKYLRTSENFIAWTKLLKVTLRGLAGRYKEVTGKDPLIHFVLILDGGVALTSRQMLALNELGVSDISVFTVDFLEKSPVS